MSLFDDDILDQDININLNKNTLHVIEYYLAWRSILFELFNNITNNYTRIQSINESLKILSVLKNNIWPIRVDFYEHPTPEVVLIDDYSTNLSESINSCIQNIDNYIIYPETFVDQILNRSHILTLTQLFPDTSEIERILSKLQQYDNIYIIYNIKNTGNLQINNDIVDKYKMYIKYLVNKELDCNYEFISFR